MSSAVSANLNKAIVLVILMITMTQVGYLDSMNSLTNGEQRLEQINDVLETGGSGSSNFTASADGAELSVDMPMTNITFDYDAAIANPQLLSKHLGIGNRVSCAILENGSVACWGESNWGTLGSYSATDILSPQITNPMPGNEKAVALDASRYIACALLGNGSVACWGFAFSYGALGSVNTVGSTPTTTPTLTDSLGAGRYAIEVSTANQGACVILDNGSVSCWGYGLYGGVGDGQESTNRFSPTPTASLPNGNKAVALTSGDSHHCALLEDGTVACWGLNTDGQLGDNSTTDRDTPTLTIPLGAPAIAIESDHAFTCALLNNGSVMCWGANAYGQIGSVSSGGDLLKPTHVANMPGTTVSVSTGVDHSCTLLSNNSVNCLGRNNANQHGNGTTGGSSAYTSPFALNQTKLMLDGGGDATCALIDNGSMYCWGRNAQGNIGDGTTNTASTPTWVDTSYKFLTRSMDKVNSATNCSTSPDLPNGLFIDNNTCTISGTPTDASVNQTYTVTANISNITFSMDATSATTNAKIDGVLSSDELTTLI